MSLKFSLRGDSLDAHFAGGWRQHSFLQTEPALVADGSAGIFGGSKINFAPNGNGVSSNLRFVGAGNVSTTGQRTFLWRLQQKHDSPLPNYQIFLMSDDGQGGRECPMYWDSAPEGQLFNTRTTEINPDAPDSGQLVWTNGQVIDVWMTYDASTGVTQWWAAPNGQAPTMIRQTTRFPSVSAWDHKADVGWFGFGYAGYSLNASDFYLNEFCMWDSLEDPTSYGVRSGFIPCPAFEGYVSTDPGIANVRQTIGYQINGVGLVGTLTVGASTDPGVDNVVAGTEYEINGAPLVGQFAVGDPKMRYTITAAVDEPQISLTVEDTVTIER